jgi:phospholipid/cholesterol/gamma-HCH transport system ATP-binding protein
MRKRAGLARALVLDPQIILCDEPDSGLDPVRTAYLSQLLIDLNAQIDATILIVTHNIQVARTVPDNMGMLFRGDLVMFGPREVLLTSEVPAVAQFLDGRRFGPIGMSEEMDEATIAMEQAHAEAGHHDGGAGSDLRAVVPQLEPTPGMPPRKAVERRKSRVISILHTLPPTAQQAILASLSTADLERYRHRMHTRAAAPPGHAPPPGQAPPPGEAPPPGQTAPPGQAAGSPGPPDPSRFRLPPPRQQPSPGAAPGAQPPQDRSPDGPQAAAPPWPPVAPPPTGPGQGGRA